MSLSDGVLCFTRRRLLHVLYINYINSFGAIPPLAHETEVKEGLDRT